MWFNCLVYILLIIWSRFIELKKRLKQKGRLWVHETNPWRNFCDPDWELILHNKWHLVTSEICTPPKIAIGTLSNEHHGTNTIPVFLPADAEACWSLLPSSIYLHSDSTVQPEITYSCILKVASQVWERQKRLSINTDNRYHQTKSDLVLTNPIGHVGCKDGWCI